MMVNECRMRMGCLTSAHSIELVLGMSTSVGLECKDVGGVELHMISKSGRKGMPRNRRNEK